MKFSRRAAWLLLFLGAGLFLSLLFWSFIVTNVVMPIATMLLLLWRLLLSIHQAFYWVLVIGLAVILILYRLVQVADREEDLSAPSSPSPLKVLNHWRYLLQMDTNEGSIVLSLRGEMRHMLVSMHALKQSDATPFAVQAALQSRELPLPNPIHNFLFSDEAEETTLPLQRLRRLANRLVKWLRHWTGRDKAEYYQAVEETLTFMETFMEIQHDDDFTPSAH